MKNTLNHTCISALLCGAVLAAVPSFAAGVGGTPAGSVNSNAASNANAAVGNGTPRTTASDTAGASTSNGGMTSSGDIDTATAGNNAGSVSTAAQTPSRHMSRKAQVNANAAEVETTRQLNQQQASIGSTATNSAGATTVQ